MHLKKINKDKVRRFLGMKFEIQLKVFKSVLCYKFFSSSILIYILNAIQKYKINNFFTRANNLCVITGRQNGVYRFYKTSRILLRDSKQDFQGLRKSSW